MYTILVCDDDRDIVAALKIYLSAEGYEVLPAYTGKEALELLENHTVHLALMDIMMPGMDGIMATTKLREKSNIPVILLTAKSEDTDKVLGLTIGADDYITKPFNPMEVMARVKSQLRRYTMLGSLQTEQVRRPKVLTIGGVMLDDESKSVQVDGEPVTLTPTEYSILKLLMQNAGQVFSTAQIYAAVWKEDACGNDSTVAVHIRHLREKIEITPAEPRYVKVVWGQGYKFEKGGKTT
ncbi:MAG TPA: response regulator transcription factor [Candidatus Butyricicoccus avicola]|nr:response regulator transcription factor [Candidatus Butyricicoccus avicola]